MGEYRPLFSIEIEHAYFPDRLCRGLEFVPTDLCSKIMDNAGLLYRKTVNGIQVYYEEEKLEVLQHYVADPSDPLNFCFKVFNNDQYFLNYSDLAFIGDDSILYFDNLNSKKTRTVPCGLHKNDSVSEADLEPLGSTILDKILNNRDRHLPPAFIVNIRAQGGSNSLFDKKLQVVSRQFQICFNSRKTIWKYFLLGNTAAANWQIMDLKKEVEFEFSGEETLVDNRTALTFRSKTLIDLQQVATTRFQLKEKGSGGKVIIRHLPMPSVKQFVKEQNGETLISDMYLNL